MKQDIQRIMLAAAKPLFLIFILYLLKIMEVGMDWDFSRLGVYPMEKRGLVGILTHPLIHSGFSHLLANSSSKSTAITVAPLKAARTMAPIPIIPQPITITNSLSITCARDTA